MFSVEIAIFACLIDVLRERKQSVAFVEGEVHLERKHTKPRDQKIAGTWDVSAREIG